MTQALVKSNVNESNSEAFRAALAYQVGAVLITPSLYYQSVRRGDSGWFNAYYSDPSAGVFNNEPFLPESSSDKWTLPSLKAQADLGFAQLVSTTSYMHRVVDASLDFGSVFFPQYPYLGGAILPTPGPGYGYNSSLAYDVPTSAADAVPSLTGQRDKVFTQEVRLASTDPQARVSWVAGLFYEHHYQEDWQSSTQSFANVCNPVNNCDPALPNPTPPNPPAPGLYGPSGPFNPGYFRFHRGSEVYRPAAGGLRPGRYSPHFQVDRHCGNTRLARILRFLGTPLPSVPLRCSPQI